MLWTTPRIRSSWKNKRSFRKQKMRTKAFLLSFAFFIASHSVSCCGRSGSDAGGSVLTGKAAEGGAAACGGTCHQAGIAAGEVVTTHVADDIQAGDGLEVLINGVHIVVDLDAVDGADQIAAGLTDAVEGSFAQGGQTDSPPYRNPRPRPWQPAHCSDPPLR